MGGRNWMKSRAIFRRSAQRIMKCLCSGEQFKTNARIRIPESLATRDYSASGYSSHIGEEERKIDTGNIEEAESSLREGGCLNYEEARALLGRLEYQRGNVEAALRVFDGIDIAAVAPKMKFSIARRAEHHKFRSYNNAVAPMSIHAVSLLFEAVFLKAKSLQDLGRFKEAAQSCNIILDTVESALPEGFPENFGTHCKLREMLSKAVELLPELWKLAGFFHEAISAYRRALLSHWNLDAEVTAKIQKEFAIFLLYSGSDASPPNLRFQPEGFFIPRNNIEEAILLLMILLKKFSLKKVEWDPSIIDHLTFALSVSGELKALANQVEELLPGVMERQERYYTLALSYLGEGDQSVGLNLLKRLFSSKENPNCVTAIILASKICAENRSLAEEGASYARKALNNLNIKCSLIAGVANRLLGRSLLSQARPFASDAERIARQSEAFEALECAIKMTKSKDYEVLYNVSLEYAEQRKLDVALRYAEHLLKLEAGSNVKVWILLARIFSAQKQFVAAEAVIDAAVDQTAKWGHGELLRLKAQIQIAQGKLKEAFETYTYLLAVLQLRSKNFGVGMKFLKGQRNDRSLEIETWHDLANIYTGLSQWKDAEICLSKSRAITPLSASRWHATGKLYDAQGRHKEAHGAYANALEIEPSHVPSLISTAVVLRQLGGNGSSATARSFLTDALVHDRTNHSAWFNLGVLCKAEGGKSVAEAVECFQAAIHFEDSAPVEPFKS